MINRSLAVFIPPLADRQHGRVGGESGGVEFALLVPQRGVRGKPQDISDVKQLHVGQPLSALPLRASADMAGPTLASCRCRSATRLRIGLFGGTFDPPHVGHLVTAVNVRHALTLDTVILMVANIPWQKQGERTITPALDRLEMVWRRSPTFRPGARSARDRRRRHEHTADTLSRAGKEYPSGAVHDRRQRRAAGLYTWERFEEVVAHSWLVVVDRPGPVGRAVRRRAWIQVEFPASRSRAPTCAPASPTAARSTTW